MKTLHHRLTSLYTITTTLILTLVMITFFIMSVRDTRQNQLDDFNNTWNSLQFRVQSDTIISQGFLAQTEATGRVIIHIEENQTPLFYNGSWIPQTDRQTLISRAKELAKAQGVDTTTPPISSSVVTSSLLSFTGDQNEDYYAMVMVLSLKKVTRSLCLIAYRPPILKVLKTTILQLCILEICGIIGLFTISWFFVSWSLKPVEESQRKQAEFIAAASHELRSPLAVLRSGAAAIQSMLLPENTNAMESKKILTTMDSECARMSRLIDDMLLLASADANTWKLVFTQVDIDTLLIETYDTYLSACRQKNVTLLLDLPEQTLPTIHADAERLKQVLFILLDNALHYSPSGSEICIQARVTAKLSRQEHASLSLSVIDHGPGIPDDAKPHVFDRFYRADSSRTDKSHFGLGLSIARELISLHKGTIQVTDTPGGGSCFTIILFCELQH